METTEKKKDEVVEMADKKEAEAMEKEAEEFGSSKVTIKFRKPFTYEDKTYEQLTFDFDKLTGMDSLEIERELEAMRIMLLVPSINGQYLVRMAARACTERVGFDYLMHLPLWEFNQIRNSARNFLNRAE